MFLKSKSLLSIVLLLAQLAATSPTIVDVEEELICPDSNNPTICYPKVFIPTNDWQIIKPDQDIPAGLHVGLNLETGEREAKLMSKEDAESNDQDEAVVVVGGDANNDNSDNNDDVFATKSNDDHANKLKHEQIASALHINKNKKVRVSHGDLTDFTSAVEKVEEYDQSKLDDVTEKERLIKALDTINDLSHDIELGEQVTSNTVLFNKLVDLASTNKDELIEEKIYNIITASLRNNPGAITNLLNGKVSGFNVANFINSLLDDISQSPDTIQKRKIGIIQALAQDPSVAQQYFSYEHPNGLNQLIKVYPTLSLDAKIRVVHLLEDLNLWQNNKEKRSDEDEEETETDPDSNLSQFIQQLLARNKFGNENDANAYFSHLAELHKSDKSLKPSSDFLQWLSKEVELRKDRKKRNDVSQQDLDFDRFMLEARHEIFGNPMGLRKATADEL